MVKAFLQRHLIIFDTNTFTDYTSRHSSDYIFYFDTEGSELNIWYNENEWVNLEVSVMLTTNGPMSMHFNEETIENNEHTI